ncbi:MAG: hypothetical protein ACTS73_09340 [Arsenophonus sp. NEOnobi-MAG3]
MAELLNNLRAHGLTVYLRLTTGEMRWFALGFWNAMAKIFPDTQQQCYCVYKTDNVLASLLLKSIQPKVKANLSGDMSG